MSKERMLEIKMRLHTLLGQCMKDRQADFVLMDIGDILADKNDGTEFAKLIQEWVSLNHDQT